MNRTRRLLGIAALTWIAAAPASAASLWQDQFDRANGNAVGNGWIELQNDDDDVAIAASRLRLRDFRLFALEDAAATRTGISTAGHGNVGITLNWAPLTASESDDLLYVSWKPSAAATWIHAGTLGLGGDGTFLTSNFSLGASAADTTIDVRLWTDVNVSAYVDVMGLPIPTDLDVGREGALVDWITVTGDLQSPLAADRAPTNGTVPTPATLPLLAAGLLGLAGRGRRQAGRITSSACASR
jgi:hypothetical protein